MNINETVLKLAWLGVKESKDSCFGKVKHENMDNK